MWDKVLEGESVMFEKGQFICKIRNSVMIEKGHISVEKLNEKTDIVDNRSQHLERRQNIVNKGTELC